MTVHISFPMGRSIDLDMAFSRKSLCVLYLVYPHFKWLHGVITLVLFEEIIKQSGLLVFLAQQSNVPRYLLAVMPGWFKSRFFILFYFNQRDQKENKFKK